ncbi:hypothetical protein [Dehalobacter sp. TeCB1]|uniref:hypothetical protein n=1 Tax=Dehalobacter sp. TeCB1 TaxID=1843715 RepID=UPI00083A8E27|nr:hypothetical protein [Dehalobacter sp. TeCB1]OCZ49924.1 hypothetical protein A7D23_00835 [Dehalobacter sp. TeCB1]
MEKENNAGYVITDRLSVGNMEFVIGQSENAPAKFVTWRCNKGEKNYHWGHYSNDRLTALEDLCNRSLDEIHHVRSLQKDVDEKPVRQTEKKSHETER